MKTVRCWKNPFEQMYDDPEWCETFATGLLRTRPELFPEKHAGCQYIKECPVYQFLKSQSSRRLTSLRDDDGREQPLTTQSSTDFFPSAFTSILEEKE